MGTTTSSSDKAASAEAKKILSQEFGPGKKQSIGCNLNLDGIKKRPLVTVDSKENNQKIELTLLSLKEVESLYKELAANKTIPFEFPFDGCYARAQAMAKIMEDKGIISGKAFLEGNLSVESKEFGPISWRYHVAPIVMVQVGGKNVPYVLDPSITTGPVTFEDWKKQMISKPGNFKSNEYFTNRFSYDPDMKFEQQNSLNSEAESDYPATNEKFSNYLQQIRLNKKSSK